MNGSEENGFWNISLVLILLVALFGMMGGSLMGPVLPALQAPFNASNETIGLVLGVYTFSTAVTMPFVGSLIDRLGRKKVAVTCLLVNGAAGSMCAFAPDFTVLLILRAIQGIGIAGLMPSAMTLINDFYQKAQKVKAMGRLSATTAIGSVLAPLIGGTLAYLNWQYPFYFYGLTIPLAAAVVFLLPKPETRGAKEKYLRQITKALTKTDIVAVLVSSFLIFFLLYTIVTYVPLKLVNSLGMTELEAGMVLAAQATTAAALALNIEKISRKISATTILTTGFLFAGTGVTLLSISSSLTTTVVLLCTFGAGMGLIQPLLNDLITTLAPEKAVGGITALFNTTKYIGQTTAPFLLGYLLLYFSIDTVFIVSGTLGIAAAFTGAIFKIKGKNRQLKKYKKR